MNRPNGNYPSNYSNYAFPGTVEARKQIQRNQIAVATERKGQADTDYFWSLVRKPHTDEIVPRRAMLGEDENQLFQSSTSTVDISSTSASEDASLMDIYDQIPVERSGEGADAIPVLTSFEELRDQLPEYLYRNILLMQYSRPTPIQRHSIPLGLAGHDLMCCAQTGSGTVFTHYAYCTSCF